MKKILLIVSFILAAMFIVVIGLWFSTDEPISESAIQKEPKTFRPSEPDISTPKTALTDNSLLNPEETEEVRVRELVRTGKMTDEEYNQWRFDKEYKKALKSNVLMRFYGKVVDQMGMPILGVRAKLVIISFNKAFTRYSKYGEDQKETPLETTTDSQGIFFIENQKGYSLRLETLEKEGYELESNYDRNYPYSGGAAGELHNPDPNNPVIFRMWKKKGAENLIHADKFYGIIPDGRVYTIDLVEKKKVEGAVAKGDLRVQIKQPPEITPKTKYEWSFIIEGIDGGIIETNDDLMYLAPEKKYQPRYEFMMSPSDIKWSNLVKRKFYIKSRNGQAYARMEVEVYANYGDSHKGIFSMKYYLNPVGSRNLEYDPLLGASLPPENK